MYRNKSPYSCRAAFHAAGYTFIELLVGMLIMGIAGYTVSTVSINLAQTTAANKDMIQFASVNGLFQQLFKGPNSCVNALGFPTNKIPVTELTKKDSNGNLIGYETPLVNGGSPILSKGMAFGNLSISSVNLKLQTTTPFSTTASGQNSFLASVQITASGKGAKTYGSSPLYVTLSTDNTGQNVITCDQLNNESPPPKCDGANGLLLTSTDGTTYSCGPAPVPYTSLDQACQKQGGYVTQLSQGGVSEYVCIINDSACPPGFSRYFNYTKTEQYQCFGGSDTNCNWGYLCTTGFHDFANIDPATEDCDAPTNRLCGPLTNGSKKCKSVVTKIACRYP